MKGYWHVVALSVGISLLMIVYNNYLILACFFIWLFLLHYFKRLGKSPLIFSLLFFIIFTAYIPSEDQLKTEITYPNEAMKLFGEIISPLTINETNVNFLFLDHETNIKIQVFYFPDDDPPSQTDFAALKYGAHCEVKGKVFIPEKSTNPGQFDYQKYLLTQGITHQITLESSDNFQCEGSALLSEVFTFREKTINYVTDHISDETAAWLNALVLGDDSLLNNGTIELFQSWSLSHLLAISGLHVGLIVGIVYFLLIKLNITTKETAHWIMILFLPLYALVAGGEPSVWRASMMVLLFILINKLNVKFSATDVLSIVFILLIIANKYVVYHIGFQLSFIVTFGLILSRRWIMSSSHIFKILKISFISQMLILPLLLNYFYIFQPLSILLNVIVVPYFSLLVIPLMFFILLLSPLSSTIVSLLDRSFVSIHDQFLSFVYFVDKISSDPFVIGDFPLLIAVIYYVFLYLFMKNVEMGKKRTAFKYGWSITLLITSIAIQPYLSSSGTVTMLDIGQGDAFVIELPYRKGVIFIDAGSTFSFDTFEPNKRVYNQIIKPYLYSRGISKVDTIILSHEHMDHVGSVSFLLEDMGVENIVISEFYELNEEIELQWINSGVVINRVSKNEIITVTGQEFLVLAPEKNIAPNENSLVLHTEIGGLSWLFTGDIYVEEEKQIIQSYPELSIDVLKVAHHGSDTSTDKNFLKQINATYGLISVGEENSYGHPVSEVLDVLSQEDVIIYRTDLYGATQYHFKNNRGTFSTYLPYDTHSN